MSDEEGSVTPIMLVLTGLVVLLVVGVADAGLMIAGHHKAAAAADAAALAAAPVTFRPFGAVGSPSREAARFAAANGTRLAACRCSVDRSWRRRTVEVVVERTVTLIGGASVTVEARAAAVFDPVEALLEQR